MLIQNLAMARCIPYFALASVAMVQSWVPLWLPSTPCGEQEMWIAMEGPTNIQTW